MIEGWQVNGVARYDSSVPLSFAAAITGGGNRPNWTGLNLTLDSNRPRGEQILRWFATTLQLNPALRLQFAEGRGRAALTCAASSRR